MNYAIKRGWRHIAEDENANWEIFTDGSAIQNRRDAIEALLAYWINDLLYAEEAMFYHLAFGTFDDQESHLYILHDEIEKMVKGLIHEASVYAEQQVDMIDLNSLIGNNTTRTQRYAQTLSEQSVYSFPKVIKESGLLLIQTAEIVKHVNYDRHA